MVVYAVEVLAKHRWASGDVDWISPSGGLVGAFIGFAVAQWGLRRRLGGERLLREYQRSLRTGELPAGADAAVWGPLLAREGRRQRRSTPVVLVGLPLLLIGVAALLAAAGPRWPVWGPVAGAAVLVGLDLLLWWSGRRQAQRIARLADRLSAPRGVDHPG